MIRLCFALVLAWMLLKARNLEQLLPWLEKRKAKCQKDLTMQEAEEALDQIQRIKGFFLWRNACLEESLALFIWSTSQKKSVNWCVGVRLAPFASHAWVEVQEEALENVAAYEKMIQI